MSCCLCDCKQAEAVVCGSCSKAEQDIARLLFRQQRMDGDVKKLRDLIDDLRSDLKSARDAQVYSHRCVCYQLPGTVKFLSCQLGNLGLLQPEWHGCGCANTWVYVVVSAQADSAKAVRQAAEQEASKQVAAVISELQSSQSALTKLGRVAEAQQQQIEAVQVTVPASCGHTACCCPAACV